MEITIAKHSGFCYGVKRAIDMALSCVEEKHVATLGPIIHNPQMVNYLAERGIHVVNSVNDMQEGTLILRSHGVGPAIYKLAEASSLKLVDATCPHVRKAQEAGREFSERGYSVVIIGEKNHPEVQSILDWSGPDAVVIETPAEAVALPWQQKTGVVVQTTFSTALFDDIIKKLQQKAEQLEIQRTICNATDARQAETKALAEKADIMIVIGGKNSANTTRLAELSQKAGCPTYHIETADELNLEWFIGKNSIGITAGASTPSWLIEEAYQKMQEFQQALEASSATLETGMVVKGKVIEIRKDEVFIDLGYKAEGIITKEELAFPVPNDAAEVVSAGQFIDVYVLDAESSEGSVKLSKLKADRISAWNILKNALDEQKPLEVTVIEAVKGGVTVSFHGIRGFIPASQLDNHYVEDLSAFSGITLQALLIELDEPKNRVVFSRRQLLEAEKREAEAKIFSSITPGTVIKGTVTRLASFGAFVDIGGVEGLIHISDLSWERVKDPGEIVTAGDTVEVDVLKVDPAAKRISLGLKQLQQDPWFEKVQSIAVGSIVTGKVVKISKFGAFVEIAPGVEGLVHLSEMADHRIASAEEVVKPGQEVPVKILSTNTETKKISLSIWQAQEAAERAEYQPYLNNQDTGLRVSIGDKLGHLLKRED